MRKLRSKAGRGSLCCVEYSHLQMEMTNVTGAGLADMLLIGPKSVRLYSGSGWKKARTVMQAAGIILPVPGTNARIMVAFSDMAGSDQQHLTEITAQTAAAKPIYHTASRNRDHRCD